MGNAYVTGRTSSTDFATPNAIQSTFGGGSQDAFVAKLNPAGSSMIYSTYLGGSGNDQGRGIVVDSSGAAYITGFTSSANFPLANPRQGTIGGAQDAFVVKVTTNPTEGRGLNDVTWINVQGGNWNVAANWQDGTGANRVPTASDNVFIDSTGTYTVTLNVTDSINSLTLGATSGSQTFNTGAFALTLTGASTVNPTGVLTLSGGTISGAGNLTINGTLNWSGGVMSGTGATNIPNGATLNLNTGSSNHLFLQRTLNNSGTAILTQVGQSGTVFFLQSGTFNNLAGSVFDLRADRGINSNGGTNLCSNAGTFRKSAGTGLSTVGVPFNNTGTIEVQTGTLEFSNGGTSSGAFNVSPGGTLEFGGGTHTLQASSSINAANAAVSFSGGTVNVAGSYNAGTTTTIAGIVTFSGTVVGVGSTLTITGTANFNSNDVTLTTLNLSSSGTLGGSGNITINGALNWSGGVMSGTGATNIPNGATLNLNTGSSNHLFLQRTLNNSGTAILTQVGQSGTVFFLQSGTFNNLTGSVFDLRADRGINSNGGTNLFSNAGTFRKSAGTGLSTVGIPFNNTGTVEVQTGTLEFSNGGTSS